MNAPHTHALFDMLVNSGIAKAQPVSRDVQILFIESAFHEAIRELHRDNPAMALVLLDDVKRLVEKWGAERVPLATADPVGLEVAQS